SGFPIRPPGVPVAPTRRSVTLPDSENDFQELLRRTRAGDEEAAAVLHARFAGIVLRVAHRMMDRRMRRRCDPLDLSPRAWKSFFVRIIHEMSFDSEEALRQYLEAVAHNKSLQARRENLSTAKRDVRREVSLDDPTRDAVVVLADPQPTPDQL